MGIGAALAQTAEVFEPKSFSGLRAELSADWIAEALQATGTVTIRRRRLPAEEMLWLVIGMALMRDRPIVDIARSLDIGGPLAPKAVSDSGAVQARTRLGKEPVAWLFARSAKVWAHRSAAADRFLGLCLYGVDGTSVRVPDSETNAERFGYSNSVRGQSGYPLVRLVALMALRSHLIAAASFGGYDKGEYTYASALWSELPDNSLCIVDRGFFSAKVLLSLHDAQRNKHWLIRGKERLKTRTLKTLGPGDEIVELTVSSEALRKDPSLPPLYTARLIHYQRAGFKPQKLLTSLTDPARFSREAIVALYHERWELELAYDEIKTEMLDRRESIRSKSPDGVEQELWGLLIAFNLVRLQMQRVATMAKVAPLRISFVTALRFIREEWLFASLPGASARAIPQHLQRLAAQLSRFILPERRPGRAYPRAVKIKMTNYPRKRRAES